MSNFAFYAEPADVAGFAVGAGELGESDEPQIAVCSKDELHALSLKEALDLANILTAIVSDLLDGELVPDGAS